MRDLGRYLVKDPKLLLGQADNYLKFHRDLNHNANLARRNLHCRNAVSVHTKHIY